MGFSGVNYEHFVNMARMFTILFCPL